jgi:hypothetical protein
MIMISLRARTFENFNPRNHSPQYGMSARIASTEARINIAIRRRMRAYCDVVIRANQAGCAEPFRS